MSVLYLIWGLLPLTVGALTLSAWFKQVTHGRNREYPRDYLKQLVYCIAGLAISILLDKTIFDRVMDAVTMGFVDPRICRWLIYPAVLTFGASVQHHFRKKEEARELEEKKRRRQKYTSQR